MSSPEFGPAAHYPLAFEVPENILGPTQLITLESLATFDPSNPSHDPRTAVAARYALEEQLAWGTTLPPSGEHGLSTYGNYQSALKNYTREARLVSLLNERIYERCSPQPADPNNFNGLMEAYAAVGVEEVLRQMHKEALQQQVFRTVAQTAIHLSDEQISWETDHGTASQDEHKILEALETQGERTVDAAVWVTRKAFGRQRVQHMSPAALAEAIGYPDEAAGALISELVAGGILTRDIKENTVRLKPHFQPRGLRAFVAAAIPPLSRRA